MPISTTNMTPGGWLKSVDIKQYADLLTGTMTDQPVTLGNRLTIGGPLTALVIATPAPPPPGYMRIYPKADGLFYKLDANGVESSMQGPQGNPGPPGAQGAIGPQGPAGTPGTNAAADTEEFLPAAAATSVNLSRTPDDILMVTRDGVAQSAVAGHYTWAGSVLTFTDAFTGAERVLVSFVIGAVGAVGPPGPPGPGADTYVYNQATPAATWTITHNLNRYPAVSVVDTGGSVVEPDVRYTDANALVVTFGSATSGKAYLN